MNAKKIRSTEGKNEGEEMKRNDRYMKRNRNLPE